MEGSSEAAQAAADIVFLAPGLSTIILSIKTARQIFQRMKAYVQYRIALCLHLEIYLTTSMVIINETIRPDLVVFIALFADLATVAVAYDHAHVEPRPVEWQLKKIWVISLILGVLLATGTVCTHHIPPFGSLCTTLPGVAQWQLINTQSSRGHRDLPGEFDAPGLTSMAAANL